MHHDVCIPHTSAAGAAAQQPAQADHLPAGPVASPPAAVLLLRAVQCFVAVLAPSGCHAGLSQSPAACYILLGAPVRHSNLMKCHTQCMNGWFKDSVCVTLTNRTGL